MYVHPLRSRMMHVPSGDRISLRTSLFVAVRYLFHCAVMRCSHVGLQVASPGFELRVVREL